MSKIILHRKHLALLLGGSRSRAGNRPLPRPQHTTPQTIVRSVRPRRPSAGLIVSIIALVIALGGTSYAAFRLPQNSVGSKQLKPRAVTTSKIKDRAITARKLNTAGVTVPKALRADSTTSAARADTANTSTHASGADHANDATHAGSADHANDATHAGSADRANDATHADSADSATNAAHAISADHASAADALPALRFTTLTLKNGWGANCAGDGVPAIAKTSEGIVYLRGGMCRQSGNSANPFDVPAGFAPSQTEYITVDENFGATGRIQITSNGQVLVEDDPNHSGSAAGATHLSGVSYTLPY